MRIIRNNFSLIPKDNYKGSIIHKDNYQGDPNQLDLGLGHMAKVHGKGSYLDPINRGHGVVHFQETFVYLNYGGLEEES